MAFFKREPKTNSFGTRTVFSNTFDAPFDANKTYKYYATIKVGDKSILTDYEAKFRSEAVAAFEEDARLLGGKLEVVGVYK